jgi:hypothetical protein
MASPCMRESQDRDAIMDAAVRERNAARSALNEFRMSTSTRGPERDISRTALLNLRFDAGVAVVDLAVRLVPPPLWFCRIYT